MFNVNGRKRDEQVETALSSIHQVLSIIASDIARKSPMIHSRIQSHMRTLEDSIGGLNGSKKPSDD
jgi:hypothetical protein